MNRIIPIQHLQRSLKDVLLTLVSVLSFGCTIAQDLPIKSLDRLDTTLTQKYQGNVPGAAVVIVKDGTTIFNKGYGLANLEYKIPISDSTVFDIASVSKHFTGYAISILVERGELSLTDDVNKYIPELPDFGKSITIHQLLHHTSGLRDWTAALRLSGLRTDDVITYGHILRMAYSQKELNFPSGSEYSYTNTGYNLLVEIVQRISGKSFRDWTDENIFKPLGMNNTYFKTDYNEITENKAQGYSLNEDGEWQNTPNNLIAPGSSSLVTTPTDYAKWMMHMDYAKGVYESIFRRMYQRGKLNNGTEISYAFGLDMASYRNTQWIDHSGGWASLRSYFTYFPEYRLSIMVMKNNQNDARDIAYDIADLFITGTLGSRISQEVTMFQKPKTIRLSSAKLKNYVGVYEIGDGNYLNIEHPDTTLKIRYNTNEKSKILPVNDSIFWVEQDGSVLSFLENGDAISYRNNEGRKIAETNTTSTEELKDYLGKFSSEELSTHYEAKIVNNQLVIYHFNHGNIYLERIWKDTFGGSLWFTKTVKFYRDADDKVIGFKVSHDRARNQDFKIVK